MSLMYLSIIGEDAARRKVYTKKGNRTMKNIKKLYEEATGRMLDAVTMSFDAIDYINEHHNKNIDMFDYGLPALCDYVKKAKLIESPTEQDVKAVNSAIHGATDTLNEILADYDDAERYLKANWPQAEEILNAAKKETSTT